MYKKVFVCTVFAAVLPFLFAGGKAERKLAKEYFELGQAFAEVSKYDKAIEFYRKAAADSAYKNAAEYNLARVYGLKNEWDNARKILEKQYKTAPDNTVICNAFAYSLAVCGKTEQAASLYKSLYDRDKGNPDAAFNYVRILITSKQYQEGLTFLESVKTAFPENAEKRIYDELEAKLKKLLEPPKEAAEADTAAKKTVETSTNDTATGASGSAA